MKKKKTPEIVHPREQEEKDFVFEEGTSEEESISRMNKQKRWLLQRDDAIQKTQLHEIKK